MYDAISRFDIQDRLAERRYLAQMRWISHQEGRSAIYRTDGTTCDHVLVTTAYRRFTLNAVQFDRIPFQF